MNICVVCGKSFEPPKGYTIKKTCSKECFKKHMGTIIPSEASVKSQFKKGQPSWNKGIPRTEWLSEEMIKKCDKTQIQNQDCKSPLSELEGVYLPHNTYRKGRVVKRTHKHNVGKNKGKIETEYYINIDWRGNRKPNNLFRRYIWESYYQQDIPKGYVVHCIDGNSENLDISNLELITRGQLAILNKSGGKK